MASKKPLLARRPARFPFVPATGRINRFFVFLGAADFYSLRRGAARKTAMFLAKMITFANPLGTYGASDYRRSRL